MGEATLDDTPEETNITEQRGIVGALVLSSAVLGLSTDAPAKSGVKLSFPGDSGVEAKSSLCLKESRLKMSKSKFRLLRIPEYRLTRHPTLFLGLVALLFLDPRLGYEIRRSTLYKRKTWIIKSMLSVLIRR
jgi:hypothetical protein